MPNKEVRHMINKIVFGCERNDSLIELLDGALYFSEKELRVAELLAQSKSENEIAEILKISENEVCEIQSSIKERVMAMLRGY
jgi:DNA-binding NarL/FixJ family response regulator